MADKNLAEIATFIGADLSVDEGIVINAVSPIDNAGSGALTFITSAKFLSRLKECQASALIAPSKLDVSDFKGAVLNHPNPYLAYAKVVQFLYPEARLKVGIHPSAVLENDVNIGSDVCVAANAVIESGVTLGDRVQIGSGCVIGADCMIGDDVCLKANVTLYNRVRLGARTRIHAGAVIGADGFGYAPDQGQWHKIPQIGSVQIGADVEIGANTTIDRGALSDTIIGDGVIIDNQIQIGHNVVIGDYSALAGAVAIAGSTTLGKRCQIGGAACIAGHISLVDDVIITGMSMVTGSIKQAGVYSSGVPVTESKRWRRNAVRFTQLDEIAKNVRQLQQTIQSKNL